MAAFADQAFCNTGSQFCNTRMFKRRNDTPKEAETSQNGRIRARAIRRDVAKRKNLCAGDPAGRRETENPFTRYFAVALSKIKRKPSSVSCEFVSVMVLDALATRTARPPVATTGAV